MATVLYCCPFVPAEWIAAHGLQPSRIAPHGISRTGTPTITWGVCPFCRAFISEIIARQDASAVIVTTVCDQMRRAAELIADQSSLPVFLMNVPSTWQSPNAQRLYQSELDRLGQFLIRCGGRLPSDDELADVMMIYDDVRRQLRSTCGTMLARQYADTIMRFHREGPSNFALPAAEKSPAGIPLAIVGGPLLHSDTALFEKVQKLGGQIVLDATETGQRTMPADFDRRAVRQSPRLELADAYFGHIPDAFRRPNSELYRWLKREIEELQVRGIIFRRYVWCDIWHAELERLREWSQLPVLDLDVDAEDGNSLDRSTGRIQAFLEMLT